jgi:hypothetical protein
MGSSGPSGGGGASRSSVAGSVGNTVVTSNYTFNAAGKTVDVSDGDCERIMFIKNLTTGDILYDIGTANATGTISGKSVRIDRSTTGMSDDDDLLVTYATNKAEINLTRSIMQEMLESLKRSTKILEKIRG